MAKFLCGKVCLGKASFRISNDVFVCVGVPPMGVRMPPGPPPGVPPQTRPLMPKPLGVLSAKPQLNKVNLSIFLHIKERELFLVIKVVDPQNEYEVKVDYARGR